MRTTFQLITDRFAGFQAEWLNVHVDFPLACSASPIRSLSARCVIPASNIDEPRIIRLFEVLLHGGPQIGGWTARQMHQAVLDAFDLSENTYRLNQLRYDLRKLKGHGLIERDGSRYAYRLSPKGVQVALLFLFVTSACAAPSPTAASITGRTRNTVQTAGGSKPPITAPTPPSNASSISWLRLDRPAPQ